MGQPDLVASLKLPSWKGRRSSSLSLRFLVPSGKMQMEIPDFIFSTPVRMVFSPFLISFLSRNRQCRYRIQLDSSGIFSISAFAT